MTTTTTESTTTHRVIDSNARNSWGALLEYPDTYPAAQPWLRSILAELDGVAWEAGIKSDKKQRGSAVNVDVYSVDVDRGLAVVQVRQAIFHPRRYTEVKKDYFLVGRNENARVFAHPIPDYRATPRVKASLEGGVRIALAKIWRCDEDDVEHIVRNGDTAFIPEYKVPEGAAEVTGEEITLAGSHQLLAAGGKIWRHEGQLYVTGKAKIEHKKGQHPTARTKAGVWRVVVGQRGVTWGFARPTAD